MPSGTSRNTPHPNEDEFAKLPEGIPDAASDMERGYVSPTPPLPREERRKSPDLRRPFWVLRVEHFLALRRNWFPVWQLLTLVVFIALVFVPAFLPEPPENATPWNNFTRFAIYAMWGIWFPLVLLSVILVGRAWCGMFCPQGAISEWASRIGLKRPIPKWMMWSGLPIVSFLLITALGQTLGVRDHPEAILELFGGTLLLALLTGLLYSYRQRAWCRHLCPIGLLLGIFSRLGAAFFSFNALRPGGDRYCNKCLCPTMVDIRYKCESRHCIACFKCITPGARNGVNLYFHRPGWEVEAIHEHNPNMAEVQFLFLATGIALGAFLWLVLPEYQTFRGVAANWFFDHGWYWAGEAGPAWLMSVHPQRGEVFTWIDFSTISAFMTGFMGFLWLTLSATTALSARLAQALAGGNWRDHFVALGYQYAPVAMISLLLGLGGELFKALLWLGTSMSEINQVKMGIFYFALFWSGHLGWSILGHIGIPARWRLMPMATGLLGSLLIGYFWKRALF
ncbi:MAG: 4Fe-4S binding protein [Magnetococcales bacterium]|nr:4Fe-4S binding protein [Magnetococcales bacterium]